MSPTPNNAEAWRAEEFQPLAECSVMLRRRDKRERYFGNSALR
jgi:hypothetical protein